MSCRDSSNWCDAFIVLVGGYKSDVDTWHNKFFAKKFFGVLVGNTLRPTQQRSKVL